jgi:hypothetical protein
MRQLRDLVNEWSREADHLVEVTKMPAHHHAGEGGRSTAELLAMAGVYRAVVDDLVGWMSCNNVTA